MGLNNKNIYDSVNKMTLKKTDILLIKVSTYAESDGDMLNITESVAELSDILKDAGIKNPIIVLGPDADLTMVSEDTLGELGYYKKDIPQTEDIDNYYD